MIGAAMQELPTQEIAKSSHTQESQPHPSTSSGMSTATPSVSSTPAGSALVSLIRHTQGDRCHFDFDPATLESTPKGARLTGVCRKCGAPAKRYAHKIMVGQTMRCECVLGGKYKDTRATMLGKRYQCMRQRCYRDSHVSSRNYKGRGIEVRFTREEFILWALETWPEETFQNKDFDRIDNSGHYEKSNLRLVDRSRNLKNTRRSARSNRVLAEEFLATHPDCKLTPRHILNLIQMGKTSEEIAELASKPADCSAAKVAEKAQQRAESFVGFWKANASSLAPMSEDQAKDLWTRRATENQIRQLSGFMSGSVSRESVPQALLFMLEHPEFPYYKDTLLEIFNSQQRNWDMVLRYCREKESSPTRMAEKFVAQYPGTYSLVTAATHFRKQGTWDMLLAKARIKFASNPCMTS